MRDPHARYSREVTITERRRDDARTSSYYLRAFDLRMRPGMPTVRPTDCAYAGARRSS